MEDTLILAFENTPYLVSAIAGILTFLSPCVLPLVPAYLSYITGMSAKELSSENNKGFLKQIVIIKSSLLFIFGFSVIFISLGAMMAGLMENFFRYDFIKWLAGGIIIVFGLHFIGIIKINFLYYEKRIDINTTYSNNKNFISNILNKIYPFILGMAFALGWTPCIGPIFASIVSLASNDNIGGLSLMIAYTLGLGIPFFISALLTSYFMSFFNNFKHHLKKVEIISGILLIFIGIAIISGTLGNLSLILMEYIPY
jgi:cytochrome c-type biogenesis protein